MAGYTKWYGDRFLAILNAELRKRVSDCVYAIADRAKKLLSVPGTGQRWRSTGKGPNKKRKRSTVYGFSPSAPGDPPRKQRGRLRAGIADEVHDTPQGPVGRAGTNVKYGRPLELGAQAVRNKVYGKPTRPFTWRLLARPWLKRALTEMTPYIKAVMTRPIKL